MSKPKKDEKVDFRPAGSVSPPETTFVDPQTGEYRRVDKKAALKEWFSSAKSKTNSKVVETRMIDPKQAIYGNYGNKKRSKKNG